MTDSTMPFDWLVTDTGYRSASPASRKAMMDLAMACAFGVRIDRTFEEMQSLGYAAQVTDLQKALRYNGPLLRDLKVYTYAVWCARKGSSTAQFVRARNVAVNARYENPSLLRYAEKLAAGFRVDRILTKYYRLKNDVLNLEEHSSIIAEVIGGEELRVYMSKFAFKKMKFILDTGVKMDDLLSDMREAAVYNLQRTYPNWSGVGHALAISKNAVKRRGHNIIKEHSTASRCHLQRGEDGTYSAVNVSMDPDVAAEFFDSTANFNHDGSTDESRAQDLVQSLIAVRSRAAYHWQKSYLDLVLDQDRGPFDKWCEQVGFRIDADDSSSARFRNAAALYLCVSVDQVTVFLEELRSSAHLVS